jgi:hypothetical protein
MIGAGNNLNNNNNIGDGDVPGVRLETLGSKRAVRGQSWGQLKDPSGPLRALQRTREARRKGA